MSAICRTSPLSTAAQNPASAALPGAVDATAVVLAARRGAMTKGSALGVLLVLGGIAVLGVAASRD